jgi:Tol biopolymer transport system component
MHLLRGAIASVLFMGSASACNSNRESVRPGLQSQYESTSTPVNITPPVGNGTGEGTIALVAFDEIYTMDVSGSNIKRITRTVDYAYDPDWSPDGKQIVYVTGTGVFVTDANGLEPLQLTGYSEDFFHDPKWSPDGRQIIFTKGCKLFFINSDGSGEREFAYQNRPSAWCDWMPDWSPDGQHIVFAGITLEGIGGGGSNMELYIVNVDGSGLRQLTQNFFTENQPTVMPNGIYSQTFTSEQNPAWSPVGDLIAFSMDKAPEEFAQHLYLMKADGSEEPRRLIPQSSFITEEAPSWSSDGQRLVFSAEATDRVVGLWVVNVDGTGLRRLANVSDYDQEPSWYSVH